MVELGVDILTAGNMAELFGKLDLLGCPYSAALCQAVRSMGLHGSSLVLGNAPAGLPSQRITLGDLLNAE